MPTNFTIPSAGLFRAAGDNGDAVYSFDANGVPTTYSLHSGTGPANDYTANLSNLSKYGIDFNSLPTFNRADVDTRLIQQGHVQNGSPIYNTGGGLSDLANLKGTAPSTMNYTVNNGVNTGGLPLNNPNPTGVNGQQGAPAGTAPSNSTPANAQYQAQIANIGNPASVPGTTGTYTPPAGTAAGVADTFNTSLTATLSAQQKQLQDSLAAQTTAYQSKIDGLNADNTDLKQLESLGLSSEGNLVQNEAAQKQAALQQEQDQFTQNYQARQALVGQLSTLLTTGQSIIEGMKQTTGLASIMNPRISQTMADVQAQAGVITAALSAYDSQIGLAQNQLTSSLNAITSIYGDQIKYWDSVVSFYDSQVKENNSQIATLTADQKTYIDAQIKISQDAIAQTQATATAIQNAMLNPNTALTYARAGVSLTDSPAQIEAKLGKQGYADEISQINANAAKDGYSATPIAGVAPLTVLDSQGVPHKFYAATKPGVSTGVSGNSPAGGGAIVDGKLTTTSDHITAAQQQLNASKTQGSESDGKYADPNVYLKLFTDWMHGGGTEKGFLKQFPYSTYINPSNTWLTDSMTQVVGGGAGSGAQTP